MIAIRGSTLCSDAKLATDVTKFDRTFFDSIAETLCVSRIEDWYSVRVEQVPDLLRCSTSSISHRLQSCYPHTSWLPWLFRPVSVRFWEDSKNHRTFFEWVADELGILKQSEWFHVTQDDIIVRGGQYLLHQYYEGSFFHALECIYREWSWYRWDFQHVPQHYWNYDNSRKFLDWIAEEFRINTWRDWQRVSKDNLIQRGGGGLFTRYNLHEILTFAFPDTEWQPWQFEALPSTFWDNLENLRSYLEWLWNRLAVDDVEGWYHVKYSDISDLGGSSPLGTEYSLYKALKLAYPELDFLPWLFLEQPQGYWESLDNQRSYFDWLAAKTGYTHPSMLLQDTSLQAVYNIVSLYNGGSVVAALKSLYSNEAAYLDLTTSAFQDRKLRDFVDELAESLQIASTDNWYVAKRPAILQGLEGTPYSGIPLARLLPAAYPHTAWKMWLLDTVPPEYWEDSDIRFDCMEWLWSELGLQRMEDWYGVTRSLFLEFRAEGLLHYYEGSIIRLLEDVYPGHTWFPWLSSAKYQVDWEDQNIQREFMDWFAEWKHMEDVEDWHQIKNADIAEHGSALLHLHSEVPSNLLATVYPDTSWHPWIFSPANSFWELPSNRRDYLEWLGSRLEIVTWDDWYVSRATNMWKTGGGGLMEYYGNSYAKVIMSIFCEVPWQPWRFRPLPADYWKDPLNMKSFLEFLGNQLKIKDMEDWHFIATDVVCANGGKELMELFEYSMFKLMKSTWDYDWKEWMWEKVDASYWNKDNQQRFYRWLCKRLDIRKEMDWYHVTKKEVIEHAESLLERCGSAGNFLKEMMPHVEWQPWIFEEQAEEYWNSLENHRKYFDWLAEYLGIDEVDHWYEKKRVDIPVSGGSLLVNHYNGMLHQGLEKVYLDTHWMKWKWTLLPQGYWEVEEHRRNVLDWIEDELEIVHPHDWYGLTSYQIVGHCASSLLSYAGGLINLIRSHYQDYEWSIDKWKSSNGSKAQQYLHKALCTLLPTGTEVIENFVFPGLTYSDTQLPMKFDMWIPSMNICLEFQGKQHYYPTHLWGDIRLQVVLDTEKKMGCSLSQVSLVQVPYWWDFRPRSLMAILANANVAIQ